MFTLGTAGHVDHGKSTLVQALTGMDPDRLREEKERGLTIVPGYTWFTLPSGKKVSMVDVPGHAKFIKNMLSGIASIDLALLVVAADESIMPQTIEHLNILELLNINQCLPVITKSDLVEADLIEIVREELEDVLNNSQIVWSRILQVSSTTGQGITSLKSEIDTLLLSCPPKPDLSSPKLVVDRSFSASGFGTVITGTLIEGTLTLGQSIELPLCGKNARIRAIQSHQISVERAFPGQRVALNLSGIPHKLINKGELVTLPGLYQPTNAVDTSCQFLDSLVQPLHHNCRAIFYSGTAETPCVIRLLESDKIMPGEKTKAQIVLDDKVVLAKGDYFVMRRNDTTIGGGIILDPHAVRHKRYNQATIQRLESILDDSNLEAYLEYILTIAPVTLNELAKLLYLPLSKIIELTGSLKTLSAATQICTVHPDHGIDNIDRHTILINRLSWDSLTQKILKTLAEFHNLNPMKHGMNKDALLKAIAVQKNLFSASLEKLSLEKQVMIGQPWVKLSNHVPVLEYSKRVKSNLLLKYLIQKPFSAPPLDIAQDDILTFLIEHDKVRRIDGTIIFESETYDQIVDKIKREITLKGSVTIREIRDMFSTSRKYALAIMEDLDNRGITQRVGDERKLRQS